VLGGVARGEKGEEKKEGHHLFLDRGHVPRHWEQQSALFWFVRMIAPHGHCVGDSVRKGGGKRGGERKRDPL